MIERLQWRTDQLVGPTSRVGRPSPLGNRRGKTVTNPDSNRPSARAVLDEGQDICRRCARRNRCDRVIPSAGGLIDNADVAGSIADGQDHVGLVRNTHHHGLVDNRRRTGVSNLHNEASGTKRWKVQLRCSGRHFEAHIDVQRGRLRARCLRRDRRKRANEKG